MIEPWVAVALVAALVQTLRFALQKSLRGSGLSSGGATFSRFLFGAPLALVTSGVALVAEGHGVTGFTPTFWGWVVAGGLAQIAATMATVSLFAERNFAVGVAFTKTETVLVALFSLVLLGERISFHGFIAILIGVVGVVLLSWKAGAGRLALFNRASGLGLVAGGLFAVAAISYRGATIEIASDSAFLRAAVTLAAVTSFQTLAMSVYLRLAEPGEIGRVFSRWRTTVLVGVTGMLGSLGWFVAFALQNAAYVRALGQAELVFSLFVSWFIFKDRSNAREVVGMALLLLSILALVLWV
ncbi:DMT family transporter [Maritimibacter sp. DP1N21-5]|uniref:DMT family transporter n=1 Tax=Maritimibacter sp. DP1N21-5 TaxID=2836867 RepID=UPI001C43C4A9|nr:DMT family transporter [Maritimibacter sp. DP1N21-5]MBV7409333.1 DMT family transporter [Maritimibacter sp. DP1N21-5]